MDVYRLKNTLSQQKKILYDNFFVKQIGVFGSVARNQDTVSSDIDLLVEFTKPVGFFQFARLEDYLSSLFKKKVDLVTKDALKPAIKDNILRDVIYV